MSTTEPRRLYIERAKDIPIAHNIYWATSGRQKGEFLAYAQASFVALRRYGGGFTDATRAEPLFRWQARWPFLAANEYTCTDATGAVIGLVGKSMGKAFRSAELHLLTPDGVDAKGRDVTTTPGFAKVMSGRESAFIFSFRLGTDAEVLRVSRGWGSTDPYIVTCPVYGGDRQVDWRVGAAVAIIMDVTLSRSYV